MTITTTALLLAPLGGALLAGALALVTALTGRSAGISGMAGNLVAGGRDDRAFAAAFLGGMLATGAALAALVPDFAADASGRPGAAFLLGGALVGWGARRASGCTSGHGIQGISRSSVRSLVAVLLFGLAASIVVAAWPVGDAS